MTVWTIGHSTRSLPSFVGALNGHAVELVVDVRRFPLSRRHPHFNRDALAAALPRAGIDYVHLEGLGGRRPTRRNSPNIAWQNASFRGYADYMDTPAFAEGVARLLALATERHAAIMCAEMLWWQCHRGLIGDYLKAHGHEVVHIVSAEKAEPHPYTSAARIVNGRLSYQGLFE